MERHQRQYYALGSDVLLTLVTKKTIAYVNQLFDSLQHHTVAFEQQFSRFLPGSELTKFNTQAGHQTAASPAFLRLLQAAKDLAEKTNGLYNPYILPALQQAGYLGSWPQPTTNNTLDTNFTEREIAPAETLIIGDSWASIPKNAALDFGGIGKGYLLDELAARLAKAHLNDYWLSIGGDIICSGHDNSGRPWHVAVQNAITPSSHIDSIENQFGQKLAIATSGITKRRGLQHGKAWHHIIDPQTGRPADTDILTATVTANQAILADVYAKCIVIAGARQARQYHRKGVIQSFILQIQHNTPTVKVVRS